MNSLEKFYSDNVAVSKQYFDANLIKLNYQRKLIGDIEKKHKEWSNNIYHSEESFLRDIF